MELLVRGGTLVTMDAARRVVKGDLHVRDGRIVSVLAPGAVVAHGGTVLDVRGRLVIPGLVQAHIHLCQTLFRNHADGLPLLDWLKKRIWPMEGALDETSLRASAWLGAAELLRGGTTAILDMGTVHHHDVVFEVAREAGLRLVSGKAMMDAGDGVPKTLRESTEDSLRESDALRARWDGQEQGRLRYAYAPRFVLSCTEGLLAEVGSRVKAGARVHTHASENARECEVVRRERGKDNIDYLHALGLTGPRATLAHCVHPTRAELRTLGRSKTAVAHCPGSNLKLASGIAPVIELQKAGATLALGADGAACNNNLDVFVEMRLASLLQKPAHGADALPAEEVFEMATLGGARALGLESEIGSLEPGKRADFVVLDLDLPHAAPAGGDVYSRIVHCARSADVTDVFVDGRAIVKGRETLLWDPRAVAAEAERQAARVVRAAL